MLWSDVLQLTRGDAASRVSTDSLQKTNQRVAMEDHYNVLFLCTGNSARSIMAEAILNHKGKPVFTPTALEVIPRGQCIPKR